MALFGLFTSSSKKILGVDIGTTSIKAVELSKKGKMPYLSNYALLEHFGHFLRPNDVIQANSLKMSEKSVVNLLKLLLKKANFSTKQAMASVPSFASYTTLVEMPSMTEEETQKAMSFQIQQSIPLPLSEVSVDWIKVGQRQDDQGFDKQFILIVAIANDTITQYKSIFKQAGLTLKALEVEHLAYTRAVVGADKTPTLILDIGARSSNITIVDQGFVKENNQIDYAGDSLTSSIVKGLGISYQRADELKRQRGILGGAGDFELSTLQMPFLDVILQETEKTKAHFEGQSGVSLQRVLLVGGGAALPGITEYVEGKIGLPTVQGNGLLYVESPSSVDVVAGELQTRFATSLGLAIKHFTNS